MEILEQTHEGYVTHEGHLGGWSMGGDGGTYYPTMWEFLIKKYSIKSTLDIGCGRGYASRFFKSCGCTVRAIDGSPLAKQSHLLEEKEFLFHDFTAGALDIIDPKTKKSKIFDLAWSCEFVEHVEEQYLSNFMHSFKQCKYAAMTFAGPGQDGHHHVNLKPASYWIKAFNNFGFTFLESETQELREAVKQDQIIRSQIPDVPYFYMHFIDRGLFFKNNDNN
jgi:2-polyprenyl-3-methyl-5-hydroxy-6-metoxy-1,4-benzoquinol methylase